MGEFLWYIPNTVEAGVRGDDVASGWADLERSVTLARMTEDHGWGGALFGTSWGRPDTFTGGRVLVNIVSGHDNLAAYGDHEADRSARYGRTKEFLQIVRALWTQENVTYRGDHFQVERSTGVPQPHGAECGR